MNFKFFTEKNHLKSQNALIFIWTNILCINPTLIVFISITEAPMKICVAAVIVCCFFLTVINLYMHIGKLSLTYKNIKWNIIINNNNNNNNNNGYQKMKMAFFYLPLPTGFAVPPLTHSPSIHHLPLPQFVPSRAFGYPPWHSLSLGLKHLMSLQIVL